MHTHVDADIVAGADWCATVPLGRHQLNAGWCEGADVQREGERVFAEPIEEGMLYERTGIEVKMWVKTVFG